MTKVEKETFSSVSDYLRFSAKRFPDRQAFVGENETTYQAFYSDVQKWAGHFSKHGLVKGGRVAIWLPKCLEYALSIYSSMEIGGIYVPMDGMQPVERAKKILASAQPTVLVTDRQRLTQLEGFELSLLKLVVLVDRDCDDSVVIMRSIKKGAYAVKTFSEMMQSIDYVTMFSATREDIAAIIFTSGSTGMPKGVQLSHGNLHHFIDWAVSEFNLSKEDVFSNHAGFHFDLSTFDLFAAAAVGGAVWIVHEQKQRDVMALLKGIKDNGVSVWYSVPSVLMLLVNSQGFNTKVSSCLRYVLFAGEIFPIRPLRALVSCLPEQCQLYNLYGPTETNVCTYYKVQAADLQRNEPVCIGIPLPGLSAQLIDENGDCIKGENQIGELLITGASVTPGYWNNVEALNYENHQHQRHATGDLVRYENGLLYYHGRKDRMLKINGNRVELGEIEAIFSHMPDIKEVAAIVVATESAQNIVVYYSLHDTAKKLSLLEIKRFCSQYLPRYMIPKTARKLQELPKNQNGKIDYLALKMMSVNPEILSNNQVENISNPLNSKKGDE